jgi:molecular chaperone GrpE
MAREGGQNGGVADAAVERDGGDNVARLEAEVAALKDQLLRALADQENLRRRAAREREDAVKLAAAAVIKDLLPTADSIRRAIESIPGEQAAQDELIQTLLAGVAATEKAMLDALARHGIRRIEPARGEAFDPHHHHAMMEVADRSQPAGTVSHVLQPGYAYHDRLLRPALVGVATGAGAGEGSGQTTGDATQSDQDSQAEGAKNGRI